MFASKCNQPEACVKMARFASRILVWGIVSALLPGGLDPVAAADPPLGMNLPFTRRVEWNPDADYSLMPDHGPWLITCAAFLGEEGERQARDLVRELRTEHNLEAYIYTKRFDFSGPTLGLGYQIGDEGELEYHRMRHLHRDRFDETAVLVGDFDSIDSRAINRTLRQIKVIRPQTLDLSQGQTTTQRMGVLREIQRLLHGDEEMKQRGPMRNAFVTTNPLLPDDYFGYGAVDRFVLGLNRDLEYSLLRCPGNFSVRVATFRGESTFDLKEIEAAEEEYKSNRLFGQGMASKLDEGGENAHALTKALRERGFEAYEFHDRFESYVCIGSFDWAEREVGVGITEFNPGMESLIEQFRARPGTAIDGSGRIIHGALQPLSLSELPSIFFDVEPKHAPVPRLPERRR